MGSQASAMLCALEIYTLMRQEESWASCAALEGSRRASRDLSTLGLTGPQESVIKTRRSSDLIRGTEIVKGVCKDSFVFFNRAEYCLLHQLALVRAVKALPRRKRARHCIIQNPLPFHLQTLDNIVNCKLYASLFCESVLRTRCY